LLPRQIRRTQQVAFRRFVIRVHLRPCDQRSRGIGIDSGTEGQLYELTPELIHERIRLMQSLERFAEDNAPEHFLQPGRYLRIPIGS
jgi:hypothetical protein